MVILATGPQLVVQVPQKSGASRWCPRADAQALRARTHPRDARAACWRVHARRRGRASALPTTLEPMAKLGLSHRGAGQSKSVCV